jgi:hypothetical protein
LALSFIVHRTPGVVVVVAAVVIVAVVVTKPVIVHFYDNNIKSYQDEINITKKIFLISF